MQKASANVSQELVDIIVEVVEAYFSGINEVNGWSEEARKGAGTGICSDIAKPMRIQVEVSHPVSVSDLLLCLQAFFYQHMFVFVCVSVGLGYFFFLFFTCQVLL